MDKTQKRMFIIAGANGVGKTTLAGEFLKEFRVKFLNADTIAESGKKHKLDVVKNRISAGKILFKLLQGHINKNFSFAIESTLAGRYLARIIGETKSKGYHISIIYFFVDSPEVAIDRIRIRVKKGGYSVPESDVIRRFSRSKTNFWYLYRNIVDEWSLWYNGKDVLVQVASGQKNDVVVTDEEFYKFFVKSIKK